MFILASKKLTILLFLSALFTSITCANDKNKPEVQIEQTICKQSHCEQKNNEIKPWYKKGMFWFGFFNGFNLPLLYAVVMGFDLVDTSHPAVHEKLKPFGDGACVGIGLRIGWWILNCSVISAIAIASAHSEHNVQAAKNIVPH